MLLSQGGQKEAAECGEDPPAWLRGDRKSEKKVSSFFSEFSNSFLQSTFIKQMKILHSEEKEKVCQHLNINPSFFLIFINCFASPLDISYVCFPNLLLHIQGHDMFNLFRCGLRTK